MSTCASRLNGQSLTAAFAVVTDALAVARTTRRIPRRYWPALIWPPPAVCEGVTVVLARFPTLFFSQSRFAASWKGLPPPPPDAAADLPPAPAPPAITSSPYYTS